MLVRQVREVITQVNRSVSGCPRLICVLCVFIMCVVCCVCVVLSYQEDAIIYGGGMCQTWCG